MTGVSAGGTPAVSATVTNLATTQSIGSIEFTPPDGVTVTGGDPVNGQAAQPQPNGRIRWVGQDIVPKGAPDYATKGSATYTMRVNAGCGGSSAAWSVEPKQSNDFSGVPGNTFGPLSKDSTLTPAMAGSCDLTWAPGPANAQANVAVSSIDFTPISVAPPVPAPAVRLSTPQDGVPVTVTVSPLSAATGTATSSYVVGSVDGLAVFSNIKIAKPGYYRLTATAPGAPPEDAGPILVQSDVRTCTGTTACTEDAAGSQGKVDVRLDQGKAGDKLTASVLPVSIANSPDCAPYYDSISSEWALVLATGSGSTKSITYYISKADMQAVSDNGAAHIRVCYSDMAPAGWDLSGYVLGQPVTAPFWAPGTVAPGTLPIAADIDGDDVVDGADWVLRRCADNGGQRPCEVKTSKTGAGVGVAEFLAPGGVLDPRSLG